MGIFPISSYHKSSNILTQHFFLYIMHIKGALDSFKSDSINRKLAQAWIAKLMEDPHPDNFKALKRNMYLARLIINLYEGKLQKPFTSLPTKNPIENFDDFPFHGEPRETDKRVDDNITYEVLNKELPLDELNHMSSDGRTYIAVQSLSNGNTLFGYVAITIGNVGAGPLWVNSQGKTVKSPTPNLQNLKVNSSVSREMNFDIDNQANSGLESLVYEVWNVLSQRRTLEIRERASDFYHMLYNTIEQEMLLEQNNLQSSSCRDPYVEKLISFLVKDLSADGVRDPLEYRRISLLSKLKKRIKTLIDEIRKRRGVFEQIKKTTATHKMKLLPYPSSTCPSFISIMTLQEALEGTLNTKSIDLLCMQYPPSIVEKFQKVIVNEKIHVMQLIKIRLDKMTGEMYKDLKESISRGLQNYQAARKEWERVWIVIKEYEEVSKLLAGLETSKSDNNSDERFLKAIENEINIAQLRLQIAKDKTKKLENEISLLHTKIHEMNEKYKYEQIYAEEKRRILRDEIDNEEMAIQQRVATINHLENMADNEDSNKNL